jgi:hypothetical protein
MHDRIPFGLMAAQPGSGGKLVRRGSSPAWGSLGVDAMVIPPFKARVAGDKGTTVSGELEEEVTSRKRPQVDDEVRESSYVLFLVLVST